MRVVSTGGMRVRVRVRMVRSILVRTLVVETGARAWAVEGLAGVVVVVLVRRVVRVLVFRGLVVGLVLEGARVSAVVSAGLGRVRRMSRVGGVVLLRVLGTD
jgi:hypothetical protein